MSADSRPRPPEHDAAADARPPGAAHPHANGDEPGQETPSNQYGPAPAPSLAADAAVPQAPRRRVVATGPAPLLPCELLLAVAAAVRVACR
jgi:hypothetical protein